MLERPRSLRLAPPSERRRRLIRRAAGRRSIGHRALQAIGRADQRILLALRTRRHSEGLDRAIGALGSFGELGAGWAAIGLCGAFARPVERERWLSAAAAAPIAIVVNYSVKLTIGRRRPLIDDHPPLARAPSKLSFPSAHATSAVAAATVLGRVRPGTRPPLYGLAAAICVGRPYLGMHYPSDVLAGVALGAAIGRLYPLPAEVPSPSSHDPRIGVAPSPAPPQGEARGGGRDPSDAAPPPADRHARTRSGGPGGGIA